MTHSIDTSLPLPLAIPVLTQWAHEQSSHGVRDEGSVWIQHGPLIRLASNLSTAETNLDLPIWNTPWEDQPVSLY